MQIVALMMSRASGLEFVGSASASLVDEGSSSYTVSLTALTGGSGAAPVYGDLVIVNAGSNTSFSAISGYTSVVNQNETGVNRDIYQRVAYKFMDVVPDTTVTIPKSTGPAEDKFGNGAIVEVWRYVDPVSPLDVTTTLATGTGNGKPNCPSITPVTAGAIVLAYGMGSSEAATGALTVPSGMSGLATVNSDGTQTPFDSVQGGVASVAWTSGAYNPAAFAGGSSDAQSAWCGATLALRPYL